MEGVTGYVYRNAYAKYYGGIERYFTPFVANKKLGHREKNDVCPEHNAGMAVVPQILTNRAEDFLAIAEILREYGYDTVNLNLGCPSGTVTAKGRGAGFLLFPEKLNDFFDQVFDALGDDAKLISIKTRIGYSDASEMEKLSEIYNKYPFKQLIIHPRVREDFYNGSPNLYAFEKALDTATAPVIYNGNIFSSNDFNQINGRFGEKNLAGVMLGRGLIADPSLARQIKGGKPMDVDELKSFMTELEAEYLKHFSSEHDALVKIKEIWTYLAWHFEGADSYMKKLLKAKTMIEYRVQRNLIFNNCGLNI